MKCGGMRASTLGCRFLDSCGDSLGVESSFKVVDSSFPKFLPCRRSLSNALRSTSIWSGNNQRATHLSEHSALSNDLGIPGHPPLFFSLLEKRSVTYGSRA